MTEKRRLRQFSQLSGTCTSRKESLSLHKVGK